MKNIAVFVLVVISTAIHASSSISLGQPGDASSNDYCSESLCEGVKHIACNNTGEFSFECPSNAITVEFSDRLKDLALTTHNKFRDQIARGKLKRYGKAARMATIVWNAELAKLAGYNVRRCTFAHDECRNTAVFSYAGQNLGQIKNTSKYPKAEYVIETVIKGWFEEHKDADMSYIEKFQQSKSGKMIGHFTQLVRDEAYAMGCAIVQFKKDKWFTTILACDYTLSNILDYPIYEKSSKTASSCINGINEQFRGLCNPTEIYNNELFYNL